jgi:hypothetical protein
MMPMLLVDNWDMLPLVKLWYTMSCSSILYHQREGYFRA